MTGSFGSGVAGFSSNADDVARAFDAAGIRVGVRSTAIVRHHTLLGQTRAKAHASGRPGPRAVTGDYRRSISTSVAASLRGVSGHFGTNKDQARRLENGFVGIDSIGRHYDQPAYPHFGPAYEETLPGFIAAVEHLAEL